MYIFILALPSIYLLYLLYWQYLIYILDALAHCCAFIKIRKNVVAYNLNMVLPEAKNHKDIEFKSLKLSYLNAFIALHQPYLMNRDSLSKRYIYEIPAALKSDIRSNKALLALAHYGIFYDFSSAYQILKNPIASVYKMKNTYLEKWMFHGSALKGKIFGIKHDKLHQHLNHPYRIISLPCDHKGKHVRGTFLNRETKIHSSPADLHKISKRALWVYFCKYDFTRKKIIVSFVPVERYVTSRSKCEIAQQVADIFTKAIKAQPEQYFWIHNRFRVNEPDLNRFDKIYS